MRVTFSGLRGLPVLSPSGQHLGRVLDILVRPEGEEMVAIALLVVANRLELLAERLRPGTSAVTIPVRHLAAIESSCVRLRDHHD